MHCPNCGNIKRFKVNLRTTFRKSRYSGISNEIEATCLRCKKDFSTKYTVKVVNGQVMFS